ncbi:MAG TPA: SsrA-binding protein SmpB [Candidatus Mcinerneyibacteriales bacterium]|jgi:SsrA-binding protein|nr:SsrA-binding protein SmpB [Candidatus Mcinerneyibacteriales bacterium]HPE20926.1 SsrA-binding protein SmpB [Candidatus Mcinerneyibacteriales bacterium]HPJ70315.1 SsrA-binding protein SmpB [Candidatus Mcinerneyibacteriales bacterium]
MDKFIARNKKARHEYHILETIEAGIVLTGTEVKSCRAGKLSIKESYARFIKGELYLVNAHIAPYETGSLFNHEETRTRKLLLSRQEIRKLLGKVNEEGLTLIPLAAYFNQRNVLKIELALARGKKIYDKREDIKKRDMHREAMRELKRTRG